MPNPNVDAQQAIFSQGIHALYRSVLAPDKLQLAMDAFAASVGSQLAQYLVFDLKEKRVIKNLNPARFEGKTTEVFNSYYAERTPTIWLAASARSTDRWFLCQDYISEAYVSKSEYFQDFCLPLCGIRYASGMVIPSPHDPTKLNMLAFLRDAGMSPYSEENRYWMQRSVPHLNRVIALTAEYERMRIASDLSEAALQSLPYALLVLDRNMGVRFANRSAESLCLKTTAVQLKGSRLSVTDAEHALTLRRIVQQATDPHAARGEIAVIHDSTGSALYFSAAPLPLERTPTSQLAEPFALVAMRLNGSLSAEDDVVLRELFDLTPTEAKLAQTIASGASLKDYASATGASPNTARSYLQSLFEKTNTQSQSGLANLLHSIPALRDPKL